MRAIETDHDLNLAAELDSPQAWTMVAAAFVTMFIVYGVAYSFGAFFKPMAREFGAGPSATSAVFSITVCVWSFLGWPSGHLADRIGPRPVITIGAVAIGLGLVTTSFINHLWIGYLTYGLGVGVGIACGYVPTVAVVGGWFMRRRNTALGIAVAGIGCGTLVVAPIAAALIERFGWRETYVVFGIVSAVALVGCAMVMERPPVHVAPVQFRIGEAIGTPAFKLLYVSSVLSSMGLFTPFVFLPAFARDHGSSEVAAATLVGLIGGASVVGRMGLGAIADRVGVVRLYQFCYLVVGLSFVLWLIADAYSTLVIFALVLGVGYGGWVALSPAVLAHLYGTHRLGSILGALYTSGGAGVLMGPPVAGLIIARSGYRWAIAFSLITCIAAFVALLPLDRMSRRE
ncbi:MAG TPA: MCT family MFS transporter [Candidatus Binataceae bacterium]|nr:MCT family MFS transporter [Candidatus Binataceae bacterium]